jgi:hypothetical protein
MDKNSANKFEIEPPKELSLKLVGAIQQALEEEKRSRSQRYLKSTLMAAFFTAALTLPIALLFREQMNWVWKVAGMFWGLCFLTGFSLYFHPQPKLSVPGYWSPWIFAKILIGMTLLTGFEIILCPSFVFLGSENSWSPFLPVTEWFMSWGGMKGCMFSCGLIFSGLGGLFTFATVRKVLSGSSRVAIARAIGFAYVTQFPLLLVQIADEDLRNFVGFWFLGGLLGLSLVVFLLKLTTRRA